MSTSAEREGVICLIAVAACGFASGLLYRYDASFIFLILAIIIAVAASIALVFRQVRAILYFIRLMHELILCIS